MRNGVEVQAPSVLYFNSRHYNLSDASRWAVHVYLNPADDALKTTVKFTGNNTMEILVERKQHVNSAKIFPPWPPRERKIVCDVQIVWRSAADSEHADSGPRRRVLSERAEMARGYGCKCKRTRSRARRWAQLQLQRTLALRGLECC